MSDPRVSAESPYFGEDGLAMHLGTAPRSLAPYCLIVGDPERATAIAKEYLADCQEVGNRRGMTSYTGRFNPRRALKNGPDQSFPLSISTHQMGWTLAAQAITEMAVCGARRFIRVGSCSSFVPGAKPGDIAIWNSARRIDPSVADCWVDPTLNNIPASRPVAQALSTAALQLDVRFHAGSGGTAATFEQGQGRLGLLPTLPSWYGDRVALAREHRFVGMEMEMAAVLAFGLAHRGESWAYTGPPAGHPSTTPSPDQLMCGGVTAIFANRSRDNSELRHLGVPEATRTALLAMGLLHEQYPIDPETMRHLA